MTLSWYSAIGCDRCGEVLSRRVSPLDPLRLPDAEGWIVTPLTGTAAIEHVCPECVTDEDVAASLAMDLDDWAAADGKKWTDIITARTLLPYLPKLEQHGGKA